MCLVSKKYENRHFFSRKGESIFLTPWSARPSDGINDEMVNVVHAIIQEENRCTIEQISKKMREGIVLNVSVGTVHSTLHQELEMNKVCARWVSK